MLAIDYNKRAAREVVLSAALTTTLAVLEQRIMAHANVSARPRTINRFQEEIVWGSGKFTVDSEGRVWRGSQRAEHSNSNGYLQVRVMIDSKRHYTCAHRLVWRALNGPIPTGQVVNHKNGRKDDNRPSNLELLTYSENTRHAYRTGLSDEHGERNPAAKLTDNEVAQIRNVYAQGGFTMAQIGEMFGVRFQHISRLVRGTRRPKQNGPIQSHDLRHAGDRDPSTGRFAKDRSGDPEEWPEYLRVRQFPKVEVPQ